MIHHGDTESTETKRTPGPSWFKILLFPPNLCGLCDLCGKIFFFLFLICVYPRSSAAKKFSYFFFLCALCDWKLLFPIPYLCPSAFLVIDGFNEIAASLRSSQ
jgi:hypothetical protein